MPPQEVAEVAVREADTCSQSRFFQYPVQCPFHGGFGALPQAARCGVEVFGGVTHSEKHRFDASGARRVVQLCIAVGYIADADEGGLGLRLVDRFLEAVKPRHTAEGKTFLPGEAVGVAEMFKELRCVPTSIQFIFHWC